MNMGSQTGISVGEFSLSWSQATAGARSWLYYQANSTIRFVQQPQQVEFDSVDDGMFRRYLVSRNVEEFMTAGQTVQVIGPAVFSGDLPDETPVSARVESCGIHDSAFELKLGNLTISKSYVIESSSQIKTGTWMVVHKFVAAEPNYSWADPLGSEISLVFYRIREGQ